MLYLEIHRQDLPLPYGASFDSSEERFWGMIGPPTAEISKLLEPLLKVYSP